MDTEWVVSRAGESTGTGTDFLVVDTFDLGVETVRISLVFQQ
jgi:hypothetical protein